MIGDFPHVDVEFVGVADADEGNVGDFFVEDLTDFLAQVIDGFEPPGGVHWLEVVGGDWVAVLVDDYRIVYVGVLLDHFLLIRLDSSFFSQCHFLFFF